MIAGYGCLYVFGLLAYFLLAAFTISLASRLKKKWLRISISLFLFLLLLIPPVGVSLAVFSIFRLKLQPQWLFAYTLSWTILFLIGGGFVLFKGLKTRNDVPASAAWPSIKLITGSIVFGFFCMGILWFMDGQTRREFEAARAEAAGLFKELHYENVPLRENAAPLYEEAAAMIVGPTGIAELPDWLQDLDEPDFDPTSKKVTAFLSEKREVFALLKKGASLPGYYVEIDPHNNPWPFGIIGASRMLALRARFHAKEGRLADAFEDIQIILDVSEQIGDVPYFVTTLIAISLKNTAVASLEYALSQSSGGSTTIRNYPTLNADKVRNSMIRSLTGEHVWFLTTLAEIMPSDGPSQVTLTKIWEWRGLTLVYGSFFAPYDIRATRYRFEKMKYIYSAPYHKMHEEMKDMRKGGLFSAIALPMYIGLNVKADKTIASIHAANLAIAAMKYCRQNRKYPYSIHDLAPLFVPEIPMDPFDGKPMKMESTGKNIVFYSVGQDEENEDAMEDELSFTLPKSPGCLSQH